MKRRLLILIMAICLLFALLPGMALAGNSGSYEKVNWTFTDDGTLTFSGTGYVPDAKTWADGFDKQDVKSVVINKGITEIGFWAFDGCYNLTSVSIPDGVTDIDSGAFSDCRGINSITIPDSVNNIGTSAFYGCRNLVSINIPVGVTSIGYGTFGGCNSLTNIIIPEGVTNIGKVAFSDCSSLVSINIPNSMEKIESDAFFACSKLSDIYYNGNENEWENIGAANLGNDALSRATIHFVNIPSNNTDNSDKADNTSTGISIMLNGSPLSFSQSPYIADNTTMVPMRVIFEALGAAVDYDAASQKITATKGDTVIELVLGEKTAKKNEESIALDAAAVTTNDNTMVPLRFVAEALQAQVDWGGAMQTITITME